MTTKKKTNKQYRQLGHFKVLQRPDLKPNKKKPLDPVTNEDIDLMKYIRDNILIDAYLNQLLVEEEWKLDIKFFAADWAAIRKGLRELYSEKDLLKADVRRQVLAQLKRILTRGGDAHYSRKNMFYMLPMASFEKTGAYPQVDRTYNKKTDTKTPFKLSADKKKELNLLTMNFSFSMDIWEKESKLVKVDFWDLPATARIIATQRGNKISIKEEIERKGGDVYLVYEWMRNKQSPDLESAIKYSFQKMAEDFKKATKKTLQEAIEMFKSQYPNLTELYIFNLIKDIWAKDEQDLTLENLQEKLKWRNSHQHTYFVWDSKGNCNSFPSVFHLADFLEVTENYVRSINTKDRTISGYYVTTNPEPPEALKSKVKTRKFLESLYNALIVAFGEELSQRQQVILHDLIVLQLDLEMIKEKRNLKEGDLSYIIEQNIIGTILGTSNRFKFNETPETLEVEPVQGDNVERSANLQKQTRRPDVEKAVERLGDQNISIFSHTVRKSAVREDSNLEDKKE